LAGQGELQRIVALRTGTLRTGILKLGRAGELIERTSEPLDAIKKEQALFEALRGLESVLVAYPEADSAYLAWAAIRFRRTRDCHTADRPRSRFPQTRRRRGLAIEHGIHHEVIETREFENPAYVQNGSDAVSTARTMFTRMTNWPRPRHCARHLWRKFGRSGDYRPGQGAAKLHQLKAPRSTPD